VQLRESLDIIYGLVFELRQGVEDLHFLLQTTDDKIMTLLQLLASMREAFPSYPVGANSEEVPQTAAIGGDAKEQCSVEKGREQTGCMTTEVASASRQLQHMMTDVDGAADKVTGEVLWENEVTYVEEEPWPGDLQATWSGYLPGV
jgi:hypothetical protein